MNQPHRKPSIWHFLSRSDLIVALIADADRRFTLVSSDWPQDITAISPDSKKHGRVDLAVSKAPVVIVVR